MASLDRRLNPLYAIKECSSYGNLYTKDCGCSKGSLEDKILVPVPDSSQRPLKIENFCLNCGDPVHGLYCRQCALIRKTLEEVFQDFQDTSESSDDDTNFVNENQEPFVVNQDPGKNSSQSPPHIDHCCYGCGDSLDDIFCQRCTCESCGKGAHYGYNCPPQVPITLNRNHATIKPLMSSHRLCQVFTRHPVPEMRIHSLMIPNLILLMILLTLFNAQNDLLNSQNKLMEQMTSICDMVGQYMQKKEEEKRIAEEQAAKDRYWKIPICYDDDEDYTIAITPVSSTKEPVNSLSIGDEHLDTIPATESDEVIKSSVENLVPIPSESEGIPDSVCDVPLCNNPTPLEAFKEHSETIIDSNNDYSSSDDDSYENIDYEVGGIDDDILLTIKDDILREKLLNVNLLIANIEALKDNPTPSSDVMTKSSSTSLNLFLEETNTFDNSSPEAETFCFDLEENSSGSTTTRSDYSLPDYEAFYSDDDHIKEKSSGSTTTHADFSQYDSCFFFQSLIFDQSNSSCPIGDYPDSEASHARGFGLRSQELRILSFI
ncbi:hypothetical protein Tco_0613346 [Tanacetum coccineum]